MLEDFEWNELIRRTYRTPLFHYVGSFTTWSNIILNDPYSQKLTDYITGISRTSLDLSLNIAHGLSASYKTLFKTMTLVHSLVQD